MATQATPTKLTIKLVYNSPNSTSICSSSLKVVPELPSTNTTISLTPPQVPKLRLTHSPQKPTYELHSPPETPSSETSSQADLEEMVIPAKQLADLLKAVLVKDTKTASKLQMVKAPTQFIAMMFTPGLIQMTTQKNKEHPTTEVKAKQSLKREASGVLNNKKKNSAHPTKKRQSELAQPDAEEISPSPSPAHSLGPAREYRSSGWTCMNKPAPRVTAASLLKNYQYPEIDDQPLEEVRRNAAFDDYGKH